MTGKQQLDSFIAKFSPEVASVARQAFTWMRKKFPRATVLVYDNYNALAIGFGPTDRASDGVFSIALFPRWVSLFFLQGAGLPDPNKLLQGTGKQARSIRLENVQVFDQPLVLALIDAEAARSGLPPTAGSGKIVIKSISAKQRPRRPAPAKAAKKRHSI
jgi:Domain of unknown function (DU1801)